MFKSYYAEEIEFFTICYHQTRDMATPGFPKPSRDMEKKNPGAVLANRTFWGLSIMNSYI